MRIVQVCNVGQICGGTAACAWSITRALPECHHLVLCFSRPTAETVKVFSPVGVRFIPSLDDRVLRALRPDLVIMHNTSHDRVGSIRCAVTLQYQHSRGAHAKADLTVSCSKWLAVQQREERSVLYQPVPHPPLCNLGDESGVRSLGDRLIVGRICTPVARKWPDATCDLYELLSSRFPEVDWEFVGCPEAIRKKLLAACRGRARFFSAGWSARMLYRRWDVLLYHNPALPESFGRTVAEAMLGGCVPIVDHQGGFLEQVTSGRDGFTCQKMEEFSESLAAVRDPILRWELSNEARRTAFRSFSEETFAARFRAALAELVK